jgi:hypothetical protein
MAIRKAVRSDTILDLKDGRYIPVTRSFLDSKVLEDELFEAADLFTSGLMSLGAPSGSDFVNEHNQVPNNTLVVSFHFLSLLCEIYNSLLFFCLL